MTSIMARAFVVSRLTDGQVQALHAIEKREGYLMTPSFIHEHFRTDEWGDVPEDSQALVSAAVHGIWGTCEATAAARGDLPKVMDFQRADWEIRKRGLTFSGRGSNPARERILARAS